MKNIQLVWNDDTITIEGRKGPLWLKIGLSRETTIAVIKSIVSILEKHIIDSPLCNRIIKEEVDKKL